MISKFIHKSTYIYRVCLVCNGMYCCVLSHSTHDVKMLTLFPSVISCLHLIVMLTLLPWQHYLLDMRSFYLHKSKCITCHSPAAVSYYVGLICNIKTWQLFIFLSCATYIYIIVSTMSLCTNIKILANTTKLGNILVQGPILTTN